MEPKIYHQTFYHDDNCTTLFSRNMAECKCQPDIKVEMSPSWAYSEIKIKQDFNDFWKNKAKYN